MSLINKMLNDLEARTARHDAAASPVFAGLHAVAPRARSAPWLALVAALGIAVAAYGATLAWRATLPTHTPLAGTSAPAAISDAVRSTSAPARIAPPIEAAPSATTENMPAMAAVPAPPATPAESRLQEAKTSADAVAPKTALMTKTVHPLSAVERAENAYRQALRDVQSGDIVAAKRRLGDALALDAAHLPARETLAGLLLAERRWDEAQPLLEQGLQQHPRHLRFIHWLAQLHVENGVPEQAIALIARANAEGVRDPELLAFLAGLYQRQGRYAQATAAYRQALAQNPLQGTWWMGLGLALEAEGHAAPAREAYRRALDTQGLDRNLVAYVQERRRALAGGS